MRVIDNRAILLKTDNPQQLVNIIPKSKDIGGRGALVHWGLEEAKVLRNLGFDDVPSPIEGRYNWTGLHKPMDHQITTAAFFTMNRKAYCFNQQGTGKTASVIWAADYLMSIGQIKRVLIVCPMSIMKSAWVDDLFTFAMHRTTTIAHNSDKRKRIQAINSGAEFVIINYDGLGIVEKELRAAKFDLIVADEATALKTATTKRWKTFNSLVTPDTWLWLLTGTPAAQSPLDAYGLARLVSPDRVPRFFSAFRDKVMNKVTQFKWAPKHNATEIVHEALQPAIRFTKEECMDLPELTYVTRDVQMSKQQEKYYEIIRKEMRAVTEGEEVTAVNAAARITKLLQIATGSVYTDSGEVLEFDNKDRLNTVLEVIEESSNKVIVFAPFKHSLARIHEFLESKGITSAIIGGGVPSQIRNQIFDDFQKTPDPRVLVIQPQAAAHGVTLTAADTIVWYAPTTSVELYLQGNARTHRAGQKNPCTVIRLQGSGVERHMNKMLQGNVDNHEKIVDLYKNILED